MSEKKQITVCICCDGDEEKRNKTIASFGDSYAAQVKTVVLERHEQGMCSDESAGAGRDAAENSGYGMAGKGPENASEAAIKEKVEKGDGSIVWCCDATMAAAQAATEFVTVISAGETWHGTALEQAVQYLLTAGDEADAVLCEHVTRKTPAKDGTSAGGKIVSLESAKEILRLPGSLRGIIFRTRAVREELPKLIGEEGWDELALCRVLEKKRTIAFAKDLYFCAESVFPRLDGFRKEWLDGGWYVRRLQQLESHLAADNSLFLQAQVLSEIGIFFSANAGKQNKNVLPKEALHAFLAGCGSCLRKISGELLVVDEKAHPERRMSHGLWSALEDVKYRQIPELKLSGLDFLPAVTLELLECENGKLHLDASVERFLVSQEHMEIRLRQNGKRVPIRFTKRFGGAGFFGEKIGVKAPFTAELPVESLGKTSELTFWAFDGTDEVQLPVITLDYQSKVTMHLRNSYWCFESYMVTLERKKPEVQSQAGEEADSEKKRMEDTQTEQKFSKKNKVQTAVSKKCPRPGKNSVLSIKICKFGKAQRLRRELSLLKEIAAAPYGSKKMFVMRSLYWLTRPVYGRKNIWLTFDKLYKGGDCGEYFYRYMRTRKGEVDPYYIIRSDVPDGKRLAAEGLQPLYYLTWKQRLIYLHASMIFATHSSVHGFCGFSKWEVRFVQDLLKATNTCIQHGLSVQDLTLDSNRIMNNNKRYYCASPCEIENLSRPEYDYSQEVLRLTGLARYDGLVNREQKQILITPTWRAYIAMPAVMGSSRPYNPEFKHTEYYRIFQKLLENEKLKETAKRTGYRIIYLLHPILSAQKDDFEVSGNVEILPATEINYEEILTQSSLMVTDYSGVQFDFAYMRKPVVYFHPPTLPPHFLDGGFSYGEQGFGEICQSVDELVDELCDYLESGCALKAKYRAREDAFFAFADHENCRRIFEDAMEYQRMYRS